MKSINTQAVDISQKAWALLGSIGLQPDRVRINDGWADKVFIPAEHADLFEYRRGNPSCAGDLIASEKGKSLLKEVPTAYGASKIWVMA